MITEKELLRMKADIDSAKTEISKLEGSKQTYMEQLESTWGCSSIEVAEKKLSKMKKKLSELSEKITEGLEEIEEKFIKD